MSGFLTVVLVVVSIVIVFVVIMQPSKDGGLGGLSGGGVTDSVLGAGRNEFMTKATWWLMAIFLITSLALAKHETNARLENDKKYNQKSAAEEMDLTSDDSTKTLNETVEGAVKEADATKDAAADKLETTVDKIKQEADATKKEAEKIEAPKVELPKVTPPATDK